MGHPAQHWFIVTPEYRPTPGGVADYTHIVAGELGRRGHCVDVWAPAPHTGAFTAAPGVRCHALPDHFGLGSMRALETALRAAPARTILLVQYVPSGFGMRSMNLPFALWLGRRPERCWIMFHEAVFPYRSGAPLRHQVLATATRAMLRAAVRRAERVFISIPAWEPYLRNNGYERGPIQWLPVPANVPPAADRIRVQQIRSELELLPGTIAIGHFGTYGNLIAAPLARTIDCLAASRPQLVWLFLGRHANRFKSELGQRDLQQVKSFARADLTPQEVSNHLAALDLVVLPFPDGVSTRRGSAMASLAVGVPIVTTAGPSTEAFWRRSEVAALSAASADYLAATASALIEDPSRRMLLAERARALYAERFDVSRLVNTLLCAFDETSGRPP